MHLKTFFISVNVCLILQLSDVVQAKKPCRNHGSTTTSISTSITSTTTISSSTTSTSTTSVSTTTTTLPTCGVVGQFKSGYVARGDAGPYSAGQCKAVCDQSGTPYSYYGLIETHCFCYPGSINDVQQSAPGSTTSAYFDKSCPVDSVTTTTPTGSTTVTTTTTSSRTTPLPTCGFIGRISNPIVTSTSNPNGPFTPGACKAFCDQSGITYDYYGLAETNCLCEAGSIDDVERVQQGSYDTPEYFDKSCPVDGATTTTVTTTTASTTDTTTASTTPLPCGLEGTLRGGSGVGFSDSGSAEQCQIDCQVERESGSEVRSFNYEPAQDSCSCNDQTVENAYRPQAGTGIFFYDIDCQIALNPTMTTTVSTTTATSTDLSDTTTTTTESTSALASTSITTTSDANIAFPS